MTYDPNLWWLHIGYDFEGYVWANLLWYFIHVDLSNVLVWLVVTNVGKRQEASVRQEHKFVEGTCISSYYLHKLETEES